MYYVEGEDCSTSSYAASTNVQNKSKESVLNPYGLRVNNVCTFLKI